MPHKPNKTGGGRLPPEYTPPPRDERDEPSTYNVNQVTDENRATTHKPGEEIQVALYDHNVDNLLHLVYIPRTREFPDIIIYHGNHFVFFDTEAKPPQYHEAMVASGSFHPRNKEQDNGTS